MRKDSRGFSLIELLIVVAIILIIAAIAIPNLLRSQIAARQSSAVGSLRTINTGEVTYASTYNTGYSGTLLYLGPPAAGANATSVAAGLIDSVLASGVKSSYTFTYVEVFTNGRIDSYTAMACPTAGCPPTGNAGNSYFTDQSGVIRQDTSNSASAGDSPIAG